MLRLIYFLAAVLLLPSFTSLKAADAAVSLPATEVAVLTEATVVVHVGSASADGSWLALWIDRVMKGRLRSGRDIVWVTRKELPKAQCDGKHWLVFMSSLGDGSWHIQTGGSEANIIPIENMQSPKLAEISKAIGSFGPAADPEPPSAGELAELLHKGSRGSQESRREAQQKLLSYGEAIHQDLINAISCGEREIMTLARTLLAISGSGPAVNNARLILEPAQFEMRAGDLRNLSVNFANLSLDDMRIVTGQSSTGENVVAASAYEVRPLSAAGDSAKKVAAAPQLPALMSADYGQARAAGGAPLPLIHIVPAMGILPVAVNIELERAVFEGKELLRLKFPHGYVALPGPGKYSLRVHFACPGPRPDQQRLMDLNYWGGGQLVSNEIVLLVK